MIDNFLEIKSIDPGYWGKSGWIFLNSIALTYKPENKEKYKVFFEQLPYILPCRTCGENLFKNMSSLNDALENKEKLIKWLIDLRNAIYEDNLIPQNKKTMNETFNEIFTDNPNTNMIWVYLIGLFLILVFLIFLYKYIRKDKEK